MKGPELDNDHEIEDFFQTTIVAKIAEENEKNSKEIEENIGLIEKRIIEQKAKISLLDRDIQKYVKDWNEAEGDIATTLDDLKIAQKRVESGFSIEREKTIAEVNKVLQPMTLTIIDSQNKLNTISTETNGLNTGIQTINRELLEIKEMANKSRQDISGLTKKIEIMWIAVVVEAILLAGILAAILLF